MDDDPLSKPSSRFGKTSLIFSSEPIKLGVRTFLNILSTAKLCLFVETSGVGGTHPAVLEAMAFGNCVIVNDTLENLETIGQAGLVYDGAHDGASLRTILKQLLAEPQIVAEYRQKARKHVRRYYRWDDVTDAYERLFYKLCHKELPLRLKNNGD